MGDNKSETILWVQYTPKTKDTVLSKNGEFLQSGSIEYLQTFERLISEDVQGFNVLTPTLKRKIKKRYPYFKKQQRETFLSGHFVELDNTNRRICYRALIVGAIDNAQECSFLEDAAKNVGCTISDDDRESLKKKSLDYIIITLIILIIIIIWIIRN